MSSVKARHILVTNEYEAEDLLKKMHEGVSFEELAKKFSKCPSSARGGDLLCTDDGARTIIQGECALYLTGEIEI